MPTSSADPRDPPVPFSLDALGIDPAQLRPFLAPVALPNPASAGSPLEAVAAGRPSLSLSGDPISNALTATPRPSSLSPDVTNLRLPTVQAPRPSDPLDASALSKRLEPFIADSPPIARSMPIASASSAPSIDVSRSTPAPLAFDSPFPFSYARPNTSDAGLGMSDSLGPSSTQPNLLGSTFDGSSATGDTSRIEARLTRAIDRLEQIAQQLESSGGLSRGGPSRTFRGRIDD